MRRWMRFAVLAAVAVIALATVVEAQRQGLRLLPRSAVGQSIANYLTLTTGVISAIGLVVFP